MVACMTDTAAAPRPARPKRAPKPKGQWKIDGKLTLNHNEEFKAEDDALNVKQRILDVYSKEGFASIPSDDLSGRFRWMGLYTQRKQGISGARTSKLEADELQDEYFMMRVRIDGGALTTDQLRVVAGVSTEFARNTADISDRQNVQYHWIRIEDVPEIWRRFDEVGLTTMEACGDCPRVVLGSPVAGIAADEIIDGTWAVEEIERRYIGSKEFSNLPRKYKTSISGHPSHDSVPQINDVSFVGVEHPDYGPGFDLWVGGGLSTNPMLAQRLGVWVALEDVPEVWAGVTGIFRDYGYRRLRGRARMKFLVADWGTQRFRDVLETEYLGRPLPDGPEAPAPERPGDHVGVYEQKDGRYYVGAAVTAGRVSGSLLSDVADVAERHGSGRVRTTAHQKLLFLDIEEDRVESLISALDGLGLHVRPSQWRRNALACTGIEYCKLAIVNTKDRAAELIDELERRVPELDVPISVTLNGCPNSCARIQTVDIGLKGQLMVDENGEQVAGFQVHLGGALGLEAGLGRKLRAHKVAAVDLADYIERLVRRYLDERTNGESFATWVTRADEEVLR